MKYLVLLLCLWVVDRIEGDWAVLEAPDKTMIEVRVSSLLPGSREGACAVYVNDKAPTVLPVLMKSKAIIRRFALVCRSVPW